MVAYLVWKYRKHNNCQKTDFFLAPIWQRMHQTHADIDVITQWNMCEHIKNHSRDLTQKKRFFFFSVVS